MDHPIAGYTGLYDVGKDCPEYAKDFDCRAPNDPADANPELAAKEYRKVFMPDQCQLREFDAPGFDRCMKGRRLIMIGGYCGLFCAPLQEAVLFQCWYICPGADALLPCTQGTA